MSLALGFLERAFKRLPYHHQPKQPVFEHRIRPTQPSQPAGDATRTSHTGRPVAYKVSDLIAIARYLPGIYLLPFWLGVCLALRRSEVVGVALRDWHSAERRLYVLKQRTGTSARGRQLLKSDGSKRYLPVPEWLAAAIDDYIAEYHGPDQGEWGERLLIVSDYVKPPRQRLPMNAQSLCNNVKKAAKSAGVAQPVDGESWIQPLHSGRRVPSRTFRSDPRVPGSQGSRFLGHSGSRGDGSSPTTDTYADDPEVDAITATALEDGLIAELIRHGINNPLAPTPFHHPVGLADAGRILGTDERDTEAILLAAGIPSAPGADRQRVWDRSLVLELLRERAASEEESIGIEAVAARLCLPRDRIRHLGDEGTLTPSGDGARSRYAAPGAATGFLSGGGYRYTTESVRRYEEANAQHIERRQTWRTAEDAARTLGCAQPAVRSLCTSGQLATWVDPAGGRQRIYIDPDSLTSFSKNGLMTFEESAALAKLSVATVKREVAAHRRRSSSVSIPGHLLRTEHQQMYGVR